MPSNKELIERAYGAWLKYRRGPGDAPTLSASTVETYDGLTYVFLRRGSQIAGVYRYMETKNGYVMKPMARYWPGPYGRQRTAA